MAAAVAVALQSLVYGFLLNSGGWNIVFLSLAAFTALIALVAFASTKVKAG